MKYVYSVICTLLFLFLFGLTAMADTNASGVFKISTGVEAHSLMYKQLKLIYTELFRRLDIPMQFISSPLERALTDVNNGIMDAETGRVHSFNDNNTYPNIIQLEEPVSEISVAAFTLDPALHVSRWEDLKKVTGNVAYRRGLKMAEKGIPRVVSANRTIINSSIEENCKMLFAGRIDVFVDLSADTVTTIEKNVSWRSKINKAGVVELGILYPCFNVKHKNLIPRIEKTLKAMKADGTYARLMELKGPQN